MGKLTKEFMLEHEQLKGRRETPRVLLELIKNCAVFS